MFDGLWCDGFELRQAQGPPAGSSVTLVVALAISTATMVWADVPLMIGRRPPGGI